MTAARKEVRTDLLAAGLACFAVGLAAATAVSKLHLRPPGAARWRPAIEAASGSHNVNAHLVEAMIAVTSDGRPGYKGPAGRSGIMGLKESSGSSKDDLDRGCRALAEAGRRCDWRSSLTVAAWRTGDPDLVAGWADRYRHLPERRVIELCASDDTIDFVGKVLEKWRELEPER